MTRVMAPALVCFLALTAPARADEAFSQLIRARCLQCEFTAGVSTSLQSGKLVSSPGSSPKELLTFDAIDPKTRTARLIAGEVSDVLVVPTVAGLTFVQETDAGNLTFTTVFGSYATGSQRYVAVISRHMDNSAGAPVPSQFYGTCSVLKFGTP